MTSEQSSVLKFFKNKKLLIVSEDRAVLKVATINTTMDQMTVCIVKGVNLNDEPTRLGSSPVALQSLMASFNSLFWFSTRSFTAMAHCHCSHSAVISYYRF